MPDERADDAPEGWGVRHRPAVAAAVATPVILGLLLVLAGWGYERKLRPATRQPVHGFPAPGLETLIHDGAGDPARPDPKPITDPRIEDAKRAVAQTGLAGWEAGR